MAENSKTFSCEDQNADTGLYMIQGERCVSPQQAHTHVAPWAQTQNKRVNIDSVSQSMNLCKHLLLDAKQLDIDFYNLKTTD